MQYRGKQVHTFRGNFWVASRKSVSLCFVTNNTQWWLHIYNTKHYIENMTNMKIYILYMYSFLKGKIYWELYIWYERGYAYESSIYEVYRRSSRIVPQSFLFRTQHNSKLVRKFHSTRLGSWTVKFVWSKEAIWRYWSWELLSLWNQPTISDTRWWGVASRSHMQSHKRRGNLLFWILIIWRSDRISSP